MAHRKRNYIWGWCNNIATDIKMVDAGFAVIADGSTETDDDESERNAMCGPAENIAGVKDVVDHRLAFD